MDGRSHTGRVLFAVCLALAAFSALAAYREIAPYAIGGVSDERRFDVVSSGGYRAGFSFDSKQLVLGDCLEVSGSLHARVQPTPRLRAFLEQCEIIADIVIAESPIYAIAWLVKAVAAAGLGETETLRVALAQAYHTAPNVHWLADRRAALAYSHRDMLSADNVADFDRDLRTLVDSDSGRIVLADRYVRHPDLRERLTGIVEMAPEALQRAFFERVSAATGRATQ